MYSLQLNTAQIQWKIEQKGLPLPGQKQIHSAFVFYSWTQQNRSYESSFYMSHIDGAFRVRKYIVSTVLQLPYGSFGLLLSTAKSLGAKSCSTNEVASPAEYCNYPQKHGQKKCHSDTEMDSQAQIHVGRL